MTLRHSLLMMIGGGVCAVAVAVGGAPDAIEHTRILVAGTGARAAIAALGAAVQRQIDPAGAVTIQVDSVTITRRRSAYSAARSASSHALAERAVAAVTAAALAVRPSLLPALAPHATTPALSNQRGSAQSAHDEADRRITDLSAALTAIARDTAAAQRPDTTLPSDPADASARAMLATVQLRRLDLAARYTADFPGIAIADEEIARLQTLLGDAARHRRPHPQAALATLHAEQLRVQTALDSETRRRDRLAIQLTSLDAALGAQLAQAAAPAALETLASTPYTIVDLLPTILPDPRLAACAAIGTVSLAAAWLGRGRRRGPTPADQLQAQIALIERQLQLPVLRCLDANGTPRALGRPEIRRANGQIWL